MSATTQEVDMTANVFSTARRPLVQFIDDVHDMRGSYCWCWGDGSVCELDAAMRWRPGDPVYRPGPRR